MSGEAGSRVAVAVGRGARWRYGFSAYPHPEAEAFRTKCLTLLRGGFAAMEVFAVGDVVDPEAFARYTEAIRGVVAASRAHLSVHLPTTDCNPLSRNRRVRQGALESQKAGIAWAGALGAELAVLHLGSTAVRTQTPSGPASTYFGGAWDLARSVLRELAHCAEEAGLALTVENLIGAGDVPTHPDHLLDLLDDPGTAGVGVTVDLSHALLAGWEPADYLRRVAPRVRHVHANDTDGQADRHWPLGEGRLAWRQAVAALREIGFPGTLLLEVDAPAEVLGANRAGIAAAAEV